MQLHELFKTGKKSRRVRDRDLTEEEFVRDASEGKPERSKHEEDSTCHCWPEI